MRIDLVYPTLPPAIDGIGDHTVLLAAALAEQGHTVRILTRSGRPRPAGLPDGIRIVGVWRDRLAVRPLLQRLRHDPPDAVVLQFEQFAYGARGLNPAIAATFLLLRLLRVPAARVLYAHETYVSPERLRWIPMWLYQRAQFALLMRSATLVCVAAELWVDRVVRLGRTPERVPIFANIPVAPAAGDPGFEPEDRVVLWFGYVDANRSPSLAAVASAVAEDPLAVLVYVGKDAALAAQVIGATGARSRIVADAAPESVSRLIRAADLCVAPFPGGVSTRRGSFLAELAHGAAVLTNVGASTDAILRSAAADGVFRAADGDDPRRFAALVRAALAVTPQRADRTAAIHPAAAAFYDAEFSPARAATRIVELVRG